MAKLIKFCVVLCALFAVPVFLPAQTAAELEKILETPTVTCSQAARFVCASSESQEASALNSGDAFAWAVEKGWLSKNASADAPINLGGLSFLLMKAFDMKGGMMYMIMPGPRYAFRTMTARSIIQSPADPDMNVSGERFLLILGNVLSAKGGEL
ncbi:MAG: hypothetical protein LBI04_12525 [Treponema sp.]|nr:hypothetical protein [Treponema sp.]